MLGFASALAWPLAQAPSPLKTMARESLAKISGEITVPGLTGNVEVIRDTWGVPHIYAQNMDDLFFAQGYVMAQDRLWQMEMWRREREGRMAEILGPQAVERDRVARMLKYRGPMDDSEWTSYHPQGKRIFTAYAAGINAWIQQNAKNLPVEFKLTGITPDPWTAETVVLRTATFGDASAELTLARNVVRLGVEQANKQRAPDPWDDLKVPEGLDLSVISEGVTTPGGRGGGGGGRGGNQPAILEQVPRDRRHSRRRRRRRRNRRARLEQLGRERPSLLPQASPSSPTIRIAPSPIRRSATSSISWRRAGT